jgi:hypothetical protein
MKGGSAEQLAIGMIAGSTTIKGFGKTLSEGAGGHDVGGRAGLRFGPILRTV